MKSNYTKPMLAVELFSFSKTTARDCADHIPKDRLTFDNPMDCAYDLGGITVFVAGSNVCMLDGESMDMNIGCYNNPSEGNYIFRS